MFRFYQVSDRWAACLTFRIHIAKNKFPSLELTGTIKHNGDIEISVSRPSPNKASLTSDIQNVYPPPTTGDHPESIVQREHTKTLTAGLQAGSPFPNPSISYSAQSKTGWSESHSVTETTFENISPRERFSMKFSPLPGTNFVPVTLNLAILVVSPSTPVCFATDFDFCFGTHTAR